MNCSGGRSQYILVYLCRLVNAESEFGFSGYRLAPVPPILIRLAKAYFARSRLLPLFPECKRAFGGPGVFGKFSRPGQPDFLNHRAQFNFLPIPHLPYFQGIPFLMGGQHLLKEVMEPGLRHFFDIDPQ